MPTRTRPGYRAIARTLAASVAALALAVTVGCGGEPETNIEQAGEDKSKQSEPEKNDKPSPSPTPTLEEEPYVQVALEYYEAVNEANQTGDAQRLRELSTDECETCRKTADNLEKIHAEGGRIDGGQAVPDPDVPIVAELEPGGTGASVTITYKYEAQTVVEKAGAEPEKFPAESLEREFIVKREGPKWLISQLILND